MFEYVAMIGTRIFCGHCGEARQSAQPAFIDEPGELTHIGREQKKKRRWNFLLELLGTRKLAIILLLVITSILEEKHGKNDANKSRKCP